MLGRQCVQHFIGVLLALAQDAVEALPLQQADLEQRRVEANRWQRARVRPSSTTPAAAG